MALRRLLSTATRYTQAFTQHRIRWLPTAQFQQKRFETTIAAAVHDPFSEDTSDLVAFRDLTVQQILEEKATKSPVQFVYDDSTVFDAIAAMANAKIGAVLVKSRENGKFVGILSERDYLTKIALKGLQSKTTPVREIMSKNIRYVRPTDKAMQCLKMITEGRFRHLPVIDDHGEVIDIVSIGDVVKSVVDDYHHTIHYYRDFIFGKYSKLEDVKMH